MITLHSLTLRVILTSLAVLPLVTLSHRRTVQAAEGHGVVVAIGETVEGLALTDLRLAPWNLDDAGPRRLYVFVFLDGLCAAVEDVLEPLETLAKTYREQDVFVAAINANTAESAVDAADHALRHGLTFPVLKDVRQNAKALLGVERTPDAVVLDANRRLIYRGATVDETTGDKPAGSFLLEAVVKQSLADVTLKTPERPGAGCLIRDPRPLGSSKVTYEGHVATILKQHCVRCHTADGPAPFSLTTLAAARPHAEAIRKAVEERRMPPVFASKSAGTLLDQQPLSRKELEILRLWHHSGAAGEHPPPPDTPSAGETTPKVEGAPQTEKRRYRVPIQAKSRPIISHTCDKGVSRDLWIVDCEIRPDRPGTVRHAWLLAYPFGGGRPYLVGSYSPEGPFFPKGKNRALFVRDRSRLVLRVDPFPGRSENSTVDITLHNTFVTPVHELACMPLVGPPFSLQPMVGRQTVHRRFAMEEPCEVLAFVPVVSPFVRDLTLQVEPRSAEPEVFLRLPAYDPSWQRPYQWSPGPLLEWAAQIAIVTHQDPPPERRVFGGWGPRSESHAGFLYFLRDPVER
jgi:hypothetical protein